jgi:hypothetical protein
MAAEMRNGWPNASNASAARGASSVKPAHNSGAAEVVGQEEMPHDGALAAGELSRTVATEIGLGGGLQPWGTVVLAGSQHPSEPASEPEGDDEPEPVQPRPAARPRETHAVPQVLIVNAVVPPRGGRPRGREKYPFASLMPVAEDGAGKLSGTCIFIPDADEPRKHIANARKRYRGWVFITRTARGGKMVWRQR